MILAIETSSDYLSVALADDGVVLSEIASPDARTHAERLVPTIHRLLADADHKVANLDAIAVSLGPGSYTGLRIGLSTAKGYSMAHDIPLIGVSMFEGLAAGSKPEGITCLVLSPARKDEWFGGIVRDSVSFEEPVSSGIVKLDEIIDRACDLPGPVQIITTNLQKMSPILDKMPPEIDVVELQPRARFISHVASRRLNEKVFSSLHDLEPDYGREYQAGVASNIFQKLNAGMNKD
ncbi:MAG: tRNA (adenosine(37)-N6)-threonylcarbamoyltransferase complex dimerization subunit type 1 TsaB [Rhodothermales bacterium]|nr:tRNA (adenosine(37)-N6)-threonylcarbamoyltransferase complex dimerization subunit type 1 TsaB [Rhodothermales bacterium]